MFLPLLVALAVGARADVRFVSPVEGAQTFGPTLLEIATSTPRVDRVEFSVDGRLAGVARTAPYHVIYDFGESTATHVVSAKLFADNFNHVESARVLTLALTAAASINVDLVEVPFRGMFRRAPRPSGHH